jgi:methionine--tRNA ligase beta chain
MRDMHNADLCDNIGNVIHRAASLCQSHCGGVIPDVPAPSNPPIPDLHALIEAYCNKMNKFELQGGANIAIQAFRDVNGYLQSEEPWKKKGDEFAETRQIIIRCCLEAIYALTHLLLPFLPDGGSRIFRKLGTEPVSLTELSRDCRNLKVGIPIDVGEILYVKSLSDDEIKDKESAALKKKESFAEAQRRKKESKEKAIAFSKESQKSSGTEADNDPDQPDFTKMDIRVGKIVKVWNHPEADKLFCEQIDVGEESGPREIASGLREYYTLDDMQDRKVLVVCNLKAAKIVGFTSNGMVLAAKGGDNIVELINPPQDAIIGERVSLDGLDVSSYEPATSTQIKKKKIWETVAKDLKTGDGAVAMWLDKTLLTNAGPCKATTLVGAPIS